MRVFKLSFLFLIVILFLSSYPIQTSQVQAQEIVPPPNEQGPYQVGYAIVFNISKTPSKQLPIRIYYPAEETGKDADVDKSNAPYPTLFKITGYRTGPVTYQQFAERVSSHGFIVVVVGSRASAHATERSNDTITALDWILKQNDEQSFWLNGMVDESRLAVSGHSAGGAGSVIAASKESRFNVCIPMAAALTPQYSEVGPEYAVNVQMPILIIVGEDDRGYGDIYQMAHQAYNASNTPKFLIIATNDDHMSIIRESISFKYITSFLKVYLCSEEDFISYLYGEYAQQDVDEGLIALYYDISEGEAVFTLSSLIVDPSSVKEGVSVTISANVTNTGTLSGSYTITLKIDDKVEDEKTVSLNPDETVIVSFDVTASQEGSYSVDVNGLSASYEVERAQTGIPGYPIESIIAGLAVVVLVLWFYQRND
jgi:hypothetical protein